MSRRSATRRPPLFDAWAKQDQLKHSRMLGAEVELRVGGAFRFEFNSPDGHTCYEIGTYRGVARAAPDKARRHA